MSNRPATKYGLTKAQLTQVMHFGDKLGVRKVKQHGGISEIASHLLTNTKGGITNSEAEFEERRKEFGKNYIEPLPPKSFLELMFDALQDKVLLILLGESSVMIPSLCVTTLHACLVVYTCCC